MKEYLTRFNKEWLTIEDQDKKVTLVALLVGIWSRSLYMAELAKKMPLML